MKRAAAIATTIILTGLLPLSSSGSAAATAPQAKAERTIVMKLSLLNSALVAQGRVGGDYGRGPIVIQQARCNARGKACSEFRKLRAGKTNPDGSYRLAGMPVPWCHDAKIKVRAAVPAKGGLPRSISHENTVCRYVV